MAVFPAGPYLLRFPILVDGILHVAEYNVDCIGEPAIGSAPTSVNMETRDGTPVTLSAAVNDLWAVVRGLFPTTALASAYTLVRCRPENNDVVFISGGPLTPANGATGTVYTPAGQVTLTWYSALGNIVKAVFLEGFSSGNARTPIASSGNSAVTAFNDYVLSGDNIIMARDRSFPIAGINASFGQNEAVWRRRFR